MCYSTEALKYAQTAYYSTIIMMQVINVFMCKLKQQSLFTSAFNKHIINGILLEVILSVSLIYIPGLQTIFGFRPINLMFTFASGITVAVAMFIINEIRKFIINNKAHTRVGVLVSKYFYW